MTARISGSSRRKPRSSRSRSDRRSRPRRRWRGTAIGVSSTSSLWRRSRRASSIQAWTSSRCSQASKRSGSRSVGRSRQARTSAFWTASLACSASRRMSQAARIQTGDRGACQLGEGVMIAPLRSLHEFSLHHAPRRWRGRRGRARRVWRGDRSRSFHPHGYACRTRLPSADPPLDPLREAALTRVKLQEADAKTLLVAQGLPVPAWAVARTPSRGPSCGRRFLGDWARAGRS